MTDAIQARIEQGVGIITLDRPQALNALNTPMVQAMAAVLGQWREDPAVQQVLVVSAGKAFCAGGDIRAIRQNSLDGDYAATETFFRDEYTLNLLIAEYPKPYVALIDGVCMGGGMGISIRGRYRVVSERNLMAMPETAIGFFPDVGASYFLPRLPGAIGLYLGLTGARISAADALYCGLATHYCPSAQMAPLQAQILATPGELEAILAELPRDAGPSVLQQQREAIDRCFASGQPAATLAALAAEDSAWSRELLAGLPQLSPHSWALTCELLRAGAEDTLASCLQRELQANRSATLHADFIEGIRAVLVDKDRQPVWQPLS